MKDYKKAACRQKKGAAANTKYGVGDRVKVRAGKDHGKMTRGKKGTIREIGTPALGIKFDGMAMEHKWYTGDEIKRA